MAEPKDILDDAELLAKAWTAGKNAAIGAGLTDKTAAELGDKALAELFGVVGDEKWWDARTVRDKLVEMLTPKAWVVARAAARAEAAKQGLTAAQVRGMGYADVAALCGVEIGPKGESPEWFFFEHERDRLAAEIEATVETAKLTELRLAVQAVMNSKLALGQRPTLTNADIAELVRRVG